MIAPDKTTAYAGFIKGINPDYKSSLSYMPKRHDINWINLEETFRASHLLPDPTNNLYLPNDIHRGYEGYMVAGNLIANDLSATR